MKKLITILNLFILGLFASCGGDNPVDIRKGFLGEWSFTHDLTCTPPGTKITTSEGLTISKGEDLDLTFTFSGGLVLEGFASTKTMAFIDTTIGDVTYSGTCTIQSDGTLDFFYTFDLGASYCVESGTAN